MSPLMVLALLTTPLLPISAHADAKDYPNQTHAASYDPQGDGPTLAEDLTDAYLVLDPTLERASVSAILADSTSTPLYVVYEIGATSAGTCEAKVEVVASNKSHVAIARAPGSTTLPPSPTKAVQPTHDIEADVSMTSLLGGVVPDCVVAQLESATGTVYDTDVLPVDSKIPPQQSISLPYEPVYQLPAGQAHQLTTELASSEIPYRAARDPLELDSVLYDGHWSLTGAPASPAAIDLDDVYDDVTTSITPSPGFHDVTASVAAGNANSVTTTFTVYAPGGFRPSPTGDLTGRRFVGQDSAIMFLDRRVAYVGLPPAGAPHCTPATTSATGSTGCLIYVWNKASNLLQVGDWIGAPDRAPHGRHPVRGVYYYGALSCRDYDYPAAGSTLKADVELYLDHAGFHGVPVVDVDDVVELSKDGAFELRVATDDGASHTNIKGSYRIGHDGRLMLSVKQKGRTRHVVGTVGVLQNTAGEPAPGVGLVLNLGKLDGSARGAFLTSKAPSSITDKGSDATMVWTASRFTGGTTCV